MYSKGLLYNSTGVARQKRRYMLMYYVHVRACTLGEEIRLAFKLLQYLGNHKWQRLVCVFEIINGSSLCKYRALANAYIQF